VIRFYLRRKSIGGIFDHGHKGLPDQSATELSKAAIIEKYLPLPAVVDSAPPSAATKALKVDDKRIMRLDLGGKELTKRETFWTFTNPIGSKIPGGFWELADSCSPS
jgi:hypothetical protein